MLKSTDYAGMSMATFVVGCLIDTAEIRPLHLIAFLLLTLALEIRDKEKEQWPNKKDQSPPKH